MKRTKSILIIVLAAIVTCAGVFGGIYATRNNKKSENAISQENAEKRLETLAKKIEPTASELVASPLEYDGTDDDAAELPDIDSCPVTVNPSGDNAVEIYSSPEKAGEKPTDRWLSEMAEAFNKTNGSGKIKVRNVNSGIAIDYIASGKAVPDAFAPSAMFWNDMLVAKGVDTEIITERMVGNTVGILLSKDAYDWMMETYGTIDLKNISEAVEAGELTIGYTDPNNSTGGMNYLVTTLLRYDIDNPLSETAAEGFRKFQKNIPLVALTTIQLRDAALSGKLDGLIMEYQSYVNNDVLKDYKFIPYGYRHDNPLIAMANIPEEKKEVLREFAAFCQSEEAQDRASEYGFNQNDDYTCEYPSLKGDTMLQAQKFYKENKDAGRQVIAVFVTDTSGSMEEHERMVKLKDSLINSMKYINEENQIGIVSFSSKVRIELPIAPFDMKQQTYFKGAVEHLPTTGGTATFDGIIVAADMLQKALKDNPDAKPMIFLLSDGEHTTGHSLSDVSDILVSLQIPVYTIGYETKETAKATLEKISGLSEAVSVDSNTDDIVYQLKTLFNANM